MINAIKEYCEMEIKSWTITLSRADTSSEKEEDIAEAKASIIAYRNILEIIEGGVK